MTLTPTYSSTYPNWSLRKPLPVSHRTFTYASENPYFIHHPTPACFSAYLYLCLIMSLLVLIIPYPMSHLIPPLPQTSHIYASTFSFMCLILPFLCLRKKLSGPQPTPTYTLAYTYLYLSLPL